MKKAYLFLATALLLLSSCTALSEPEPSQAVNGVLLEEDFSETAIEIPVSIGQTLSSALASSSTSGK